MALAAGFAVGCPIVSELTLAVPLVVPGEGGLRVQMRVEAPDADGRRALTLHSGGEAAATGSSKWTCHAMGVLAGEQTTDRALNEPLEAWPPPGATSLDVTHLYARLAGRGLDYGPAFQGLTAAWRAGETLYGQIALPAAEAGAAGSYGIHPALFDAALHLLAAAEAFDVEDETTAVLLPFALSNVTLHATGIRQLRVRLDRSASGVTSAGKGHAAVSMVACDATGQPVATVGLLELRRAKAAQVRGAIKGDHGDLYQVSWQPVPLAVSPIAADKVLVVGGNGRMANILGVRHVPDIAALRSLLDAGERTPERVILDKTTWPWADEAQHPATDIGLPAAQAETARALLDLQALLSEARLPKATLVWVTSSAIGTGATEGVRDLVHAPLWGLLRSARNEYADRVARLVDVDGGEPTAEELWPLLRAEDEPELAWRQGKALVARLLPADRGESTATAPSPRALRPGGTVLITGGVGDLAGRWRSIWLLTMAFVIWC